MLSLMEELRPKLGKTVQIKTKSKLYKHIADRMAKDGYDYTPVQIENKFRGLERTYKNMILNNRQSGRSRQTCAYESELHQILGQKKGIHPEYVLESGQVEPGIQSQSSNDANNSDTDMSVQGDTSSPDQPFKKKLKLGIRGQILDKITEMVEEKREYHSKVLQLLKKKDERSQKREERSRKKLELLEMLVKQREAQTK